MVDTGLSSRWTMFARSSLPMPVKQLKILEGMLHSTCWCDVVDVDDDDWWWWWLMMMMMIDDDDDDDWWWWWLMMMIIEDDDYWGWGWWIRQFLRRHNTAHVVTRAPWQKMPSYVRDISPCSFPEPASGLNDQYVVMYASCIDISVCWSVLHAQYSGILCVLPTSASHFIAVIIFEHMCTGCFL